QQKRFGYTQPHCLGGLEIDNQLEFDRLLDRQVRRLGALQNLMRVRGAAPEQGGHARAVGQEAAGRHNLSCYEHPPQTAVDEEIDDPPDAELVEGIVGHQERVGALADHGGESAVEFIRTAHRDGEQFYPQRLYRQAQLCELARVGRIIRVPKKGYAQKGGNNLLKEL